MCGICGYVSNKSLGKKLLKKMNDKISYRGPNADGYYIDNLGENKEIGLAHKRLAILDLSSSANQPMTSKNGDIILIFNGEIYNYIILREELQEKGYLFNTNSDTEVIINGYLEYGINIVNKLNGMFAIALFDKREGTLYLIRDHIGVKPLYYYKDNTDLVFASELKPIMEFPGFQKKLDMNSLDMYLYHGYITGEKSIFKSVYKLLPGHYLKYKNGVIELKEYWSVKEAYKNKKEKQESLEKWKEIVKNHLEKSINERLISDVPIGAFLSGGIDSSIIVSIMQKLSKVPVKTFSIGFKNKEYDETKYAKRIAEYLGTEHTEYYLEIEDIKTLIKEIPKYYDEPFADSSQIPTMMVSKLARKQVTVTLTGDGGDELFCGYSTYEHYKRFSKYVPLFKVAQIIPFKHFFIKKLSSRYTHIFKFDTEDNLINAGYLNYLEKDSLIKNYKKTILNNRYSSLNTLSQNIQEKAMLRDLITYLPDDILTKVDRASMKYSLESRAPFIDDYKFIELSFNIPHSLKFKNYERKYLLKQILYDYIPKELVDRPKKGFSIPIDEILRNDINFLLDEYLNDIFLEKQNIFKVKEIKKYLKLFKNNKNIEYQGLYVNKLIWHLLIFQMWYKEYMIERG